MSPSGKPARHLLADDHVAEIRALVQQLERAVDRIVIGEGDEVHAARLRDAVDVGRRRIAVAAAEKRHRAAHLRVARVDVKIGAEHRHHRSGFSNRICSVVEPSWP